MDAQTAALEKEHEAVSAASVVFVLLLQIVDSSFCKYFVEDFFVEC